MNKEKRVLAYTLAKTIDSASLSEVSGGNSHETVKRTTLMTSGGPGGFDVAFDINSDC